MEKKHFPFLENILSQALEFSCQALLVYNPKQVLYETVSSLLGFFDGITQSEADGLLLAELFHLGTCLLKDALGDLRVKKKILFFKFPINLTFVYQVR